jgi:hypothetical protein
LKKTSPEPNPNPLLKKEEENHKAPFFIERDSEKVKNGK